MEELGNVQSEKANKRRLELEGRMAAYIAEWAGSFGATVYQAAAASSKVVDPNVLSGEEKAVESYVGSYDEFSKTAREEGKSASDIGHSYRAITTDIIV